MDLSDVTWELDSAHWHAARASNYGQAIGLATLAERYLGMKYSKPKRVQMSNWENLLNERQKNCRLSITI